MKRRGSATTAIVAICLGIGLAAVTVPATGASAGATDAPGSWLVIAHMAQGDLGSTQPIACPATNWCLSLSTNTEWNGSSWTPAPQPIQSASDKYFELDALACPNDHTCFTVGYDQPEDQYVHGAQILQAERPVLEHFDGSRWAVDPIPTSSRRSETLTAVGCASEHLCFAMGDSTAYQPEVDDPLGGPVRQPPPNSLLLLRWNGASWHPMAITSQSDHDYNVTGLSCASPRFCVAVGTNNPDGGGGGSRAPFLAVWDGKSWKEGVPTSLTNGMPRYVSAQLNEGLSNVVCRAPSFCAVSGYVGGRHPSDTFGYYGADPTYPFLDTVDGGQWSSPTVEEYSDTGNIAAVALSIACPSRTDCVLAGVYDESAQGLIQDWNGTTLTTVPTPGEKAPGNQYVFAGEFSAVACPSLKVCFAAGTYYRPGKDGGAIIEEGPPRAWR